MAHVATAVAGITMSDDSQKRVPTEAEVRVIMFQAMEQMFLHSQASTEFLKKLDARVAGTETVAAVVDANASDVVAMREVSARKEVISHLFDKSHQYVTVIIGGAFAAYFTTLGTLAPRFKDMELRLSALLMTFSLAVFVGWEVFNMAYIGRHTFAGDYGLITDQPRWLKRGWVLALALSIVPAVAAIGLSLFVYLRGLGVGDLWHHVGSWLSTLA